MVEIKLISIILWSVTASLLMIFILISSSIYRVNKDKIFIYYAFYCFFLSAYVIYKFDFYQPYLDWIIERRNPAFGFMVQVTYHAFYMMFGIRFLEFHSYYPKIFKYLNRYSQVLIGISILGILVHFLPFISRQIYSIFFLYIFLPIHLSLAFFIIIKSLKTRAFARYYFTTGSFLYMALSMYALFISSKVVNNPIPNWVDPIDFFYAAIILECLVFSYGLSYRIRLLHNQRLTIQKELEIAQQIMQEKLKEEINIQQKENLILLEQKQKQELITKVAFLQQKVLRSQINSHFIFNVLNSIKLFILENDAPKASLYLGKFARFIREVLDNSINDLTNLSDELKTIELYLNIEQMRFNDIFKYKIDIQENLNLIRYPFPPLLLQPFVENALWHGLMQVEKDARLIIRVYADAGGLIIEIDDNGIGYNKSMSTKKEGHQSLGLKIVQERIEHYNQSQQFEINYTITDKSDTGNKNGTIVRIILRSLESIN